MSARIPVVIDTDNSLGVPGSEVDDAFAIAAAFGAEEIDVLAVTAVHGNAGLAETARATRELVKAFGSEAVVAEGSARPLVVEPSGDVPPQADSDDALDEMSATIRARPGQVVILALGPMTNLARLFAREPDLVKLVREVVGMGGSYLRTTGRLDLPGEFNVWTDPDATAAVFRSGAAIRMVGLDVTEEVRLTLADATALAGTNGVRAHLGAQTIEWISAVALRRPGDSRAQASCAMHDAMAVAALVKPELFDWRDACLEVETTSELTRGVVVADLGLSASSPAPNARIAVGVREREALAWLRSAVRFPAYGEC
ncbi:nucleoside hydrolase [Microbacterium sp.]|uniref:nucleoside hydrolase n=1 Tax=Microbacterium sp. TaxID=51671 RepID=UPI003F96F2F7